MITEKPREKLKIFQLNFCFPQTLLPDTSMQFWRTCAKISVQNQNIFFSKSEIVWKVIFIQNVCFSLTRSPRHVEFNFRSPLKKFLPPETPKLPSGSSILTTKSPFFQKKFFKKIRWTVKWSFGNLAQTFWQKFKKPKKVKFF